MMTMRQMLWMNDRVYIAVFLNVLVMVAVSLPIVSHGAEETVIGYAFVIAEESTKESQNFPFADRLIYNYSANQSLRFLEGKKFGEGEIAAFVKSMLLESRLPKVSKLKDIVVSERLWINAPAASVMEESSREGIDAIVFLNLKSIALVQAINQGKTLLRYNRMKPEETVTYDYFYNIPGDVAVIDVKRNAIILRNSLDGLDFLPPRQKNKDNPAELLEQTALELGDFLHDVIKNNSNLIGQTSEPPQPPVGQ